MIPRHGKDDTKSWLRLNEWLISLNDSSLPYTVTLTANRAGLVGSDPQVIGTTDIIQGVFESHSSALSQLGGELENITNSPQHILFDMTLSQPEWHKLMFHTRSLDLIGFTGLMRSSIYSTDISIINQESTSLKQQANSLGFSSGIIIESFVIDDLQDNDNVAMRLSGVTLPSLDLWDTIAVSSSRSRFSIEMNGDVGEYLVESYSKSVGALGSKYSIRLGEAGNVSDILDRSEIVYENLQVLCDDIALSTGNGVANLTIDSLPSLLSSFGSTVLADLRTLIDADNVASATYTFRIYAYRAVFIAIDSFDLIML